MTTLVLDPRKPSSFTIFTPSKSSTCLVSSLSVVPMDIERLFYKPSRTLEEVGAGGNSASLYKCIRLERFILFFWDFQECN